MTVHRDYQNALPADRQAAGKEDVSAVVCVKEGDRAGGVSSYTRGGTCTHHYRTVDVYVFDMKSRQTVGHFSLEGANSGTCPSSKEAGSHINVYGDRPSPSTVSQRLIGSASNYAQ
jgi:hypothetical protein